MKRKNSKLIYKKKIKYEENTNIKIIKIQAIKVQKYALKYKVILIIFSQ